MTGDFNQAVREGMSEQGMTGDYTLVDTNAEMLITHGVDPKSKAATCIECHNGNGSSNLILPFAELGYHTFPASVSNCILCHEQKSAAWERMHNDHVRSKGIDCTQCHTSEPIGFVKAKTDLCNDCHDYKESEKIDELHKHHLEKGYLCGQCHEFS